ncbi:MAG TPA: sulfotransferase [Acidimicrobiales bacterium]|nr:sulfotransferase [Acidimicrobiales bacterium]
MTLRVVGAGLGRTGTHSLKLALEQLLGGPCYHMVEVFGHPEHVPLWRDAALGQPTDWDALFEGYAATVDWPGASVWEQMAAHYPDAIVLLSVRDSADAWWKSASNTIFQAIEQNAVAGDNPQWYEMVQAMFATFTPDWRDEAAAKAAYEAHNAHVRATVPAERLVDYTAGDGWEPLCTALGVPVPDAPFPHVNSTEEFRAMTGLDAPPA